MGTSGKTNQAGKSSGKKNPKKKSSIRISKFLQFPRKFVARYGKHVKFILSSG